MRGVVERGTGDAFKITSPEVLWKDYGQHALNVCSGTVQPLPQPVGCILIDCQSRGKLRLHDHRLAERRRDEDIRPIGDSCAGQTKPNHIRPLGMHRLVVPIWISSPQSTRQSAVRLRVSH